MDIRSSMDGLKTLLGVPLTTPVQPQQVRSGQSVGATPLGGDHATLSSAGTEVSQTASMPTCARTRSRLCRRRSRREATAYRFRPWPARWWTQC